MAGGNTKGTKKSALTATAIINQVFGSSKKEIEGVNGLKIDSVYVDALNKFDSTHRAAIIEIALENIDITKVAQEYTKKKEDVESE